MIFDEKKKNSDRGLIFLHFFGLTCHWNVYCYSWCRWEKLLPMVSFFLPLVLLPLGQFSNQRQEFLPMVHSCLWCCNNMQHKVGMKSEWDERHQRSFILKCNHNLFNNHANTRSRTFSPPRYDSWLTLTLSWSVYSTCIQITHACSSRVWNIVE